MPSWHGFDLGDWIDSELEVPTLAMNDANAAALAEWRWGGHEAACADRLSTLVFLTMSTGLGAGVVIEGAPFEGVRGLAAEVGRIRLAPDGPAGFGAFGTAEGFASGPGIAQLARAEVTRCVQSGEPTGLVDAGVPRADITAELVCELASDGDDAALRVVGVAAERLGQLIAIIANVLEPDVVVLGTIASAHPHLFIDRALVSARRDTVVQIAEKLRIVPSKLEQRWAKQALAVSVRALECHSAG
jgi:glucokinase